MAIRWLTGRDSAPEPVPDVPSDWSLDQAERFGALKRCGWDLTVAVPLWADYTRRQFARHRFETGRWHDDY